MLHFPLAIIKKTKKTMETARIILDLILILLGLYFVLLKSFFSEKGKNLATKQDIQEITEKIESVKLEYTKKSEQNKYELDLNNQLFNALNTLQNFLRTINNNHSEAGIKAFWTNFETSKNEINKLHINYSSTYYTQYKTVGAQFEQIITEFIKSSNAKDLEKTTQNIDELIKTIEAYKSEIYRFIKS
jgi:cell division protein FtsB